MSLVNQYILDDKRVMGKNISKARNELQGKDIIIREMNRSRQYVV